MKKIILLIAMFFVYSYKCFSQKTIDTLLTTSTSATALYTMPEVTTNNLIDNIIKMIVAITTAILTQILKDIFISKKKKK